MEAWEPDGVTKEEDAREERQSPELANMLGAEQTVSQQGERQAPHVCVKFLICHGTEDYVYARLVICQIHKQGDTFLFAWYCIVSYNV